MVVKYPQLGAAEIGAKMRGEIPSASDAQALHMVDEVVARLPAAGERSARGAEKPSSASAWFLIAANLLPLYGVLAWNWEVFPLLALFWMENVVIGAINVARMLLVDPSDPMLWAAKIPAVPFFCLHYGMFTAIHGAFLFSLFGGTGYEVNGLSLFGPAMRAARDLNLWLPLGALALSHLFSFLWNYLYRGEFRRAGLTELMGRPYMRVVVLHLAIILGGTAAIAMHSPLWALVALVAIKIAVDLHAHRREHKAGA